MLYHVSQEMPRVVAQVAVRTKGATWPPRVRRAVRRHQPAGRSPVTPCGLPFLTPFSQSETAKSDAMLSLHVPLLLSALAIGFGAVIWL